MTADGRSRIDSEDYASLVGRALRHDRAGGRRARAGAARKDLGRAAAWPAVRSRPAEGGATSATRPDARDASWPISSSFETRSRCRVADLPVEKATVNGRVGV